MTYLKNGGIVERGLSWDEALAWAEKEAARPGKPRVRIYEERSGFPRIAWSANDL